MLASLYAKPFHFKSEIRLKRKRGVTAMTGQRGLQKHRKVEFDE